MTQLTILEKLRKSKEINVEYDQVTFIFQSPSQEFVLNQLALGQSKKEGDSKLAEGELSVLDIAKEYIQRWQFMTEQKLGIVNGDDVINLEFDQDLFDIYLSDNTQLAAFFFNEFVERTIKTMNERDKLGKPGNIITPKRNSKK